MSNIQHQMLKLRTLRDHLTDLEWWDSAHFQDSDTSLGVYAPETCLTQQQVSLFTRESLRRMPCPYELSRAYVAQLLAAPLSLRAWRDVTRTARCWDNDGTAEITTSLIEFAHGRDWNSDGFVDFLERALEK